MTLPLPCAPLQPNFYLGKTPGSFVQLVMPDEFYPATLDDARVDHTLISGAHATQHSGKVRRRYGFTWTARLAEASDQIVSIHAGMLGPAPYWLVDPLWRNILPRHISSAGRRLQNSTGFNPTVGTTTYVGSTVPSPVMASGLPIGVQAWAGSGTGSILYTNGSATGGLDTDAPPCVVSPAGVGLLPITLSCWLKTATSTVTGLQLGYYVSDVTGALLTQADLTACNLTTGWAQFSGTLAAAAIPAGAAQIGLRLRSTTAANPVIHLSGLMGNYYTASVAGTGQTKLQPWVLGLGVPQMLIGSSAPSNHAKATHRRTGALDLVEAL